MVNNEYCLSHMSYFNDLGVGKMSDKINIEYRGVENDCHPY